MAESRREELLAGLRQEQEILKQKLAELDGQRAKIREELAGIDGAVAAMTGEKKARRKNSTGKGKGGATTEEVFTHVRTVLAELKSATPDELRERVGERVAAAGQSRSGLHIQLKRVLGGEEFVRDGEQVRLA